MFIHGRLCQEFENVDVILFDKIISMYSIKNVIVLFNALVDAKSFPSKNYSFFLYYSCQSALDH